MKSKDITIKNILLMLLILLPIIMIVLEKNGITLMNNTYVYIYLAIYIGISITYVLLTNKTCNWLGIFVVAYLIFVCFSYLGSYVSYKSPSNKNTVIVEYINVFPHAEKLKVYKRSFIIFKKELVETPAAGSGDYKILWKGDSSVIVTGTPIASFRNSFENGSLDNHYKNMINKGTIELIFTEGILINIE